VPSARPHLPSEYGVPTDADGLLPWEFVDERMAAAPNYWIVTVGPGEAPHARPIDGVWVDGAFCFGGSPKTRWVRNLQSNARMSVHLPHDDEVVILEGTAELVTDAAHPIAKPTAQAQRDKYPQYYGNVAEDAPFRPFWMLRPATVYAWSLSGFPGNVTSWHLE
jgi:hypothetical protein